MPASHRSRLHINKGLFQGSRSNPVEIAARQSTFEKFVSEFTDRSKIKRVLDYGGDRGQYIPAWLGDEKFVYEVSEGVSVVPGTTLLRSIKNLRGIDFVICSNVLEHVSYPSEILRDIKGTCNKGAKIFIDVPFELEGNDYPIFFHEHINQFNCDSLSALLSSNGFTLQRIERVDISFHDSTIKAVYAVAEN